MKDLLLNAIEAAWGKKFGVSDICKLVSVIGRFQSIDVGMFLKCVRQVEEACFQDTSNQAVSLVDLSAFLDGISQSGLLSGNVIIKKVLSDECPGIRDRILNISRTAS